MGVRRDAAALGACRVALNPFYRERTLLDDLRDAARPPDPTPHVHFHEHGGVRHSHVHAHTFPDWHAHSTRSDTAYTEEHGT